MEKGAKFCGMPWVQRCSVFLHVLVDHPLTDLLFWILCRYRSSRIWYQSVSSQLRLVFVEPDANTVRKKRSCMHVLLPHYVRNNQYLQYYFATMFYKMLFRIFSQKFPRGSKLVLKIRKSPSRLKCGFFLAH